MAFIHLGEKMKTTYSLLFVLYLLLQIMQINKALNGKATFDTFIFIIINSVVLFWSFYKAFKDE